MAHSTAYTYVVLRFCKMSKRTVNLCKSKSLMFLVFGAHGGHSHTYTHTYTYSHTHILCLRMCEEQPVIQKKFIHIYMGIVHRQCDSMDQSEEEKNIESIWFPISRRLLLPWRPLVNGLGLCLWYSFGNGRRCTYILLRIVLIARPNRM